MKYKALIAYLLFSVMSAVTMAADMVREQRIAEQIEDSIMDGEAVWLKNGDSEFLGILMETTRKQQKGAVILVHGSGANPDWIDIIQPLRVALPDYGWVTLSLQMPVASANARDAEWDKIVPESFPRITSAIKQLEAKGISNIILLSHSYGARMATEYLNASVPKSITALVVIGLSSSKQSISLDTLSKINIPVLDIYGSEDLVSVKKTAPLRQLTINRRTDAPSYTQIQVAGADHMFTGQDSALITRVKSWLHKQVAGKEIPNK